MSVTILLVYGISHSHVFNLYLLFPRQLFFSYVFRESRLFFSFFPITATFTYNNTQYILKRVAKHHVEGWGKHLIPWGVYSDTYTACSPLHDHNNAKNEEEENENELEPLAASAESGNARKRKSNDSLFCGIRISWKRFVFQILVWGCITLITSLLAGLVIFLPLHKYLIKVVRAMMENLRCRPNHLEVVLVTFAFPLVIDITQYIVVDYIIKHKILPSKPSSSSSLSPSSGEIIGS